MPAGSGGGQSDACWLSSQVKEGGPAKIDLPDGVSGAALAQQARIMAALCAIDHIMEGLAIDI